MRSLLLFLFAAGGSACAPAPPGDPYLAQIDGETRLACNPAPLVAAGLAGFGGAVQRSASGVSSIMLSSVFGVTDHFVTMTQSSCVRSVEPFSGAVNVTFWGPNYGASGNGEVQMKSSALFPLGSSAFVITAESSTPDDFGARFTRCFLLTPPTATNPLANIISYNPVLPGMSPALFFNNSFGGGGVPDFYAARNTTGRDGLCMATAIAGILLTVSCPPPTHPPVPPKHNYTLTNPNRSPEQEYDTHLGVGTNFTWGHVSDAAALPQNCSSVRFLLNFCAPSLRPSVRPSSHLNQTIFIRRVDKPRPYPQLFKSFLIREPLIASPHHRR